MLKSADLLQTLYNLLNEWLLASGYIHIDDTRGQVLKEPDKSPESLSYLWIRRTGDTEWPIALLGYHPRHTAAAISLLGDYQGDIQTNDYADYWQVAVMEGITQLCCMAHARDNFIDAQKVATSKKEKSVKPTWALT